MVKGINMNYNKIIKKYAVKFINEYGNQPFNGYPRLIDHIFYYADVENCNTIEDLINLLNEDVSLCCNILQFAIEYSKEFKTLSGKFTVQNVQLGEAPDWQEDPYELCIVAELDGILFIIDEFDYLVVKKEVKCYDHFQVQPKD